MEHFLTDLKKYTWLIGRAEGNEIDDETCKEALRTRSVLQFRFFSKAETEYGLFDLIIVAEVDDADMATFIAVGSNPVDDFIIEICFTMKGIQYSASLIGYEEALTLGRTISGRAEWGSNQRLIDAALNRKNVSVLIEAGGLKDRAIHNFSNLKIVDENEFTARDTKRRAKVTFLSSKTGCTFRAVPDDDGSNNTRIVFYAGKLIHYF